MKKEEIKMILILIIISVIVIGGLLLWKSNKRENSKQKNQGIEQNEENRENKIEKYVQELEDGSKLNVSDDLLEKKELNGLEITNIQLKEIGGITTLLADVKNATGKATTGKMIKVDILDASGNIITTVRGYIDSIEEGKKVQLNMSVTADVANAYDFRISEL